MNAVPGCFGHDGAIAFKLSEGSGPDRPAGSPHSSEGRKAKLFAGSPWAFVFFGLALAVLLTDLPPERAWPVAALVFVGVLVAAVPEKAWRRFLGRIEKAQMGPIGFDLRQEAGQAAAHVPYSDAGEGPDSPPSGEAKTMFDLRIRLEYKLTYVAKHLLAPEEGNATFLTIGSLKLDGLLTEAEARTAIGILSTKQEELERLPGPLRERFLREAGEFVDGVRASIFWGQVKRTLSDAKRLEGEISSKGRRKDLLARSEDGVVRVAPALALEKNSKILAGVVKRLNRESADRDGFRRLVVIPDRPKEDPQSAGDSDPGVVPLASLRAALEAA